MTLLQLKCCKCGHEWEEPPTKSRYIGGTMYPDPPSVCQCGSVYAIWVNYEAMKKSNFK